ncbi:MAG: hypothetical protein LC791_10200 [Acidobacteria bacterium]|nr:hypothetical protein [Acidobacteriota bacterium]
MSNAGAADDRPNVMDGASMGRHYALVIIIQVLAISLLAWIAATFR